VVTSATCPTCGLEVRLAAPWRPQHMPVWKHREDPPDGHTAPLAVPPPPEQVKRPWESPPGPTILEQREATEDDMSPTILRHWTKLAACKRKATYALAQLPPSKKTGEAVQVATIGIRASSEGRHAVAVWWQRRPESGPTPWQVNMCRAWTDEPGSYQSLPVAKLATWLTEGEAS
jgi:hypothetical protein